jgi:hypothetical protein
LLITLKTDSLDYDYIVKPSPNPTFAHLNLVGIYVSPVFYAIDLTNEKRFYYGKSIFLNSNDTNRIILPAVRKFWQKTFPQYWTRSYP